MSRRSTSSAVALLAALVLGLGPAAGACCAVLGACAVGMDSASAEAPSMSPCHGSEGSSEVAATLGAPCCCRMESSPARPAEGPALPATVASVQTVEHPAVLPATTAPQPAPAASPPSRGAPVPSLPTPSASFQVLLL